MFMAAWPSFAADRNGYTAQYECRAGGPNCNVDVATYVAHACDQTITSADSAATISSKISTTAATPVPNSIPADTDPNRRSFEPPSIPAMPSRMNT